MCFFDEMEDSHEKIIRDHKLIDDNNDKNKRQFVRIEITPPAGDVFTNVDGWNFKVDEGETPVWWRVGLEKSARSVCKNYIAKVVFENKDGIELKSGRGWFKKCVNIVLRGSSHAELWGSSHAVLRESSHADKIENDGIAIDKTGDVPKIIVANKKIKTEIFKAKV
jgi:hypothetical protein